MLKNEESCSSWGLLDGEMMSVWLCKPLSLRIMFSILLNPCPYLNGHATATYPCNPFLWLSEWKTFPVQVFGRHAVQVHDVLLTRRALHRAHILAREHSVIFTWVVLLDVHNEIVNTLELIRLPLIALTFFSMFANFRFVASFSVKLLVNVFRSSLCLASCLRSKSSRSVFVTSPMLSSIERSCFAFSFLNDSKSDLTR